MYGPLGPARRRSSVFGAAKYVSNIVSPCHRPLAAGSQSSARTPISGTPTLWGATGEKVVRNHLKVSRICHSAVRRLTITKFAHKARVVGNPCMRTLLAALDMAAESRRAAALDG